MNDNLKEAGGCSCLRIREAREVAQMEAAADRPVTEVALVVMKLLQ